MVYVYNMENFYENGVTIIAIITVVLGCIIMTLKVLFKSKCVDVSICYGMFHIQRNVDLETEIIETTPNQNQNNSILV